MDNNNLEKNTESVAEAAVEAYVDPKASSKKKKILAIIISAIAIILCLVLILCLAFCGTPPTKKEPEKSSSDTEVGEVVEEAICPDCYYYFDLTQDMIDNGGGICPHCGYEFTMEEIYGDDWVDDFDDWSDDWSDDWGDLPEEDLTITTKLYNSKKPIMKNFRGASSTVYHGFAYMPDKYNRQYTEEMAQLEFDRLAAANMKYARTQFRSQWAWDATKKCYNWDTDRMKAFYKYCKEMDKRGINIILTTGWHFDTPILAKKQNGVIVGYNYIYGINECQYIYGNEPGVDNLYGELDGYDFTGLDEDQIRIRKIGLRLGEWARQAIVEMRKRGINNISHVLVFVEPSSQGSKESGPEGPSAAELANCVTGYKMAFRKDNLTNDILIMGPNQGGGHTGKLNDYMLKYHHDLYEVISGHNYPHAPDDTKTDAFAEDAAATYSAFENKMKKYDKLNREYWNDEFQANSDNARNGSPSGWNGLNSTVSLIVGMNYNVQNTSWWQYYDQLWLDSTSTNSEFNAGIHVVGMHPSFFVSSIPKPQYYAAALTCKYINSEAATVYPVKYDIYSGVYMNALKDENGDWTIMVVNANYWDQPIQVDLDKAINKTLYRSVYQAIDPRCSTAAHIPDPDRVFKNVKTVLHDTLPAGAVAMYSSRKY